VEDWVKLTLGIALNGLSLVGWHTSVLAGLMGALEKNIRVALAEMNPASDFLNSLAASDDPGIPYSIIAGNTSMITSVIPAALEQQPEKESSMLERLKESLFNTVVALPFSGVPNDIAVTVESIKSLPKWRGLRPTQVSLLPDIQEVACDHMSYFLSEPNEVGLKALVAAITQQK
jgi:hypothetical protein